MGSLETIITPGEKRLFLDLQWPTKWIPLDSLLYTLSSAPAWTRW